MIRYRYRAKDWNGNTVGGIHKAGNEDEVLSYLDSRNLVALDIRKQAVAGSPLQKMSGPAPFRFWRAEFPGKRGGLARDLLVFCRQFGTMLQSGITALHALKVLTRQSENQAFRQVLRGMALGLEKGNTLAECFECHPDFYPHLLISMVEAGEASGALAMVMAHLADHFERRHNLEEKIRSAITYPVAVSVVALLVILVMVLFVLPKFSGIFADLGLEPPWLTRLLMGSGQVIVNYWYLVLGSILLLNLGVCHYIKTAGGKKVVDRLKLWFPLFGPLYRKSIVARFSRTLSTLLAGGVDILWSLELIERVIGNEPYCQLLGKAREVLRQGQPLASSLAAGRLFPPMLVEMVRVGEETGALDEMLARSADFYENELAYGLERLGTTIEPVLLIGLGLFVGVLVMALIVPLFQIYRTI